MDENMTEHLVNVQQQALQLAMIVQRIEDGQNSAAGQSGELGHSIFGQLTHILLLGASLCLTDTVFTTCFNGRISILVLLDNDTRGG